VVDSKKILKVGYFIGKWF